MFLRRAINVSITTTCKPSGLAGGLRWLKTLACLAVLSLFLLTTSGPPAVAQYDDSNPAVYWRMERARQQKLRQRRESARPARRVIQRPTRLIRRARPRRGFTLAVPTAPRNARPRVAVPSGPAVHKPASPADAPSPALPPAITPSPAAVPADAPQQAGAPASVPKQDAKPDNSGAPAVPGEPKPVAVTPGPAAPMMKIVVIGDNLGSQLARGLATGYDDRPQIEIVRLTKDNSGLVRQDYYDWNKELGAILSGNGKIDIAVMMIGSNDRQSIRDADGVHSPGSDPWKKIYLARVKNLVDQFQVKKIPLIWVGMPVMRNERLSNDMVAFNQMYREIVQKAGGTYVDIWEAFLDDRNRFTLYGPDVNGEIVKLRVADGVHFTKAGARKLAHFAEINIKRILDRRKPVTPDAAIAAVTQPPATQNPAALAKPSGSPKPDAAKLPPGGSMRAALPPPDAPARVVIRERPAAGPIVPLTAAPLAPGGELLQPGKPTSASAAQRTIASGRPADARPGRADDFRWPRP